jgi:hypothetical protein
MVDNSTLVSLSKVYFSQKKKKCGSWCTVKVFLAKLHVVFLGLEVGGGGHQHPQE